MYLAEVGVGDVGIDLGGGDVGVAEHGLDGAKVGTIHEEIGGEAVAEGVRRDVLRDAGLAGVFLDDALDGARSEAAEITGGVELALVFAVVEEEGGEGIGAGVEIILDAFGGGLGDKDGAVFLAFAADDEFATFEIDTITVKFSEFGDTEAAREEEFDDGAVAETGFVAGVDGVEEIFYFVVVEEGDLFADDVGEFDEGRVEGFDAALGEVFEEAAEGDEVVRLSDDFEIFAFFVGFAVELEAEFAEEFGGDVDGEEVVQLDIVAFDDAEVGGFFKDVHGDVLEAQKIATVVVGGFFRAALLDFEAFDEIDDEFSEGRLVFDGGLNEDRVVSGLNSDGSSIGFIHKHIITLLLDIWRKVV